MQESRRKKYPREEATHRNMMSRCYNPNATGYEYYGGRGIRVCDSWHDFYRFMDDMGPRPEGMTLDRINTNLGYNPENCRWATNKEQARNKSDNVFLVYNGVSKTISDWAEDLGVLPNTIQYRIYRGWSVPEILGFKNREKTIAKRKLTSEQMLYAESEYSKGRKQTSIALELGVHSSVISRIIKEIRQERKK